MKKSQFQSKQKEGNNKAEPSKTNKTKEKKISETKMCFIDKSNKVKSLASLILGRKRQDKKDQ